MKGLISFIKLNKNFAGQETPIKNSKKKPKTKQKLTNWEEIFATYTTKGK